jgi:hypothetical protein
VPAPKTFNKIIQLKLTKDFVLEWKIGNKKREMKGQAEVQPTQPDSQVMQNH